MTERMADPNLPAEPNRSSLQTSEGGVGGARRTRCANVDKKRSAPTRRALPRRFPAAATRAMRAPNAGGRPLADGEFPERRDGAVPTTARLCTDAHTQGGRERALTNTGEESTGGKAKQLRRGLHRACVCDRKACTRASDEDCTPCEAASRPSDSPRDVQVPPYILCLCCLPPL